MKPSHVELQIVDANGTTEQWIAFDICDDWRATYDGNAPEYPVETGDPVGDHVVLKPIEYHLRGRFSNTPVEVGLYPLGEPSRRCETVKKLLIDARTARKRIVVTTDIDNDDGCYITALSFERSLSTAGGIAVDMTLRHVIVTSATIITVPRVPKAIKHKKGKKPTTNCGLEIDEAYKLGFKDGKELAAQAAQAPANPGVPTVPGIPTYNPPWPLDRVHQEMKRPDPVSAPVRARTPLTANDVAWP